jgi:hypothetical protein
MNGPVLRARPSPSAFPVAPTCPDSPTTAPVLYPAYTYAPLTPPPPTPPAPTGPGLFSAGLRASKALPYRPIVHPVQPEPEAQPTAGSVYSFPSSPSAGTPTHPAGCARDCVRRLGLRFPYFTYLAARPDAPVPVFPQLPPSARLMQTHTDNIMGIPQQTSGPSAGIYMYELDPSTSSGTNRFPDRPQSLTPSAGSSATSHDFYASSSSEPILGPSAPTPFPSLSRPLTSSERALLSTLDALKLFLATAPQRWGPTPPPSAGPALHRFPLPGGELVSCVLWKGLYHITGTDVVRALVFRFAAFGRPVRNIKKFEEGVFSDLRNLKPGVDACLEEPKVLFRSFHAAYLR